MIYFKKPFSTDQEIDLIIGDSSPTVMGCSVTVASESLPSDSRKHKVTTDEPWACPHPEVVDGLCIFHAPNDGVSAERQAAAIDAIFAGKATNDVAATARVLKGKFQTVAPSTPDGVKPILCPTSHLCPVARFQRGPKHPCVIHCV